MAMATFARQTGAFVIAEGIEDEDTLEFLRGIDDRDLVSGTIIQGGQGFGLGRPSADIAQGFPAMLHGEHADRDPVSELPPTRRQISAAASAARRPA